MGYLWDIYGIFMGYLWDIYGIFMILQYTSYCIMPSQKEREAA
jgi:hypothetical protein